MNQPATSLTALMENPVAAAQKEQLRIAAAATVAEFQAAEEELTRLCEMYPDFMQQLRSAAMKYNAARTKADQAVRALGETVGDFRVKYTKKTVDVNALHNIVGTSGILEMGGTSQLITKYTVTLDQVLRAHTEGLLTTEQLKEIVEISPVIEKPKEIDLP